ncbi:protein kinase domain-containing protein, partial [Coleofasciculus sp.]|uniref:protein kinase domain-containing protein n=1 Tax=Coleofasciculus sp. TaxID=3100458 RepID=UPI003A323945
MINPRYFSPPQTPKIFRLPHYDEVILNINNGCKYWIGSNIGQGNFGKVYECRDEWGNDLVAKVISPKNQSYQQVRERWFDEANKLLYLRHPNITYMYDAFEYSDTFYLIIE